MLESKLLCTAELKLSDTIEVGSTPWGNRSIGELGSARFEGERFRAKLRGAAAADWALIAPDGSVEIDVRLSLETDDGALVYLSYQGNLDPDRGEQPILAFMRFETGDERYAWMNRLCAVGKASFADGAVRYEIYELR